MTSATGPTALAGGCGVGGRGALARIGMDILHEATVKKSLKKMAFLGAMLGGVAGCVNQAKDVASYRNVLHASAKPAPANLPRVLTLRRAMLLANDNDESLGISGEDYVQALIAKTRAADAFVPTISFAPVYSQIKKYSTSAFPSAFSPTKFFPTHYFDAPINAHLKINPFFTATGLQYTALNARERKYALLALQQRVLLKVAQVYYRVLESQRSVRVLRETLHVERQRVLSIQRKEKVGIAKPLDVLQSEADMAATRVQLTDAENAVVTGRATLGYLVGAPTVASRLLDQFQPPAVASVRVIETVARQRRPDLRAAAAAVRAARQYVSGQIERYFPSITLNFNTFLVKQSFPTDSWWSALATANVPLLNLPIINADVRTAYSELRQTILRESEIRRELAEQARIAYANWYTSRRRALDLHRELLAAQSAYQQAVHSFSVGLSTNLDVITEQDRELASRLAYNTEQYNGKVAALAVLEVEGRLNYNTVELLPQRPAASPVKPHVKTLRPKHVGASPTGGVAVK